MSESYVIWGRLTGRVAVTAAGGAVLALLAGVAVTSDQAPPPVPAASITTVPASAVARAVRAPVAVRYTFDGGAGKQVMDASGRYALRARAAVGGTLGFSRHGAGWAAVFPARCTALPQNCPRTILEGGDPAALNPGVRRLQYGAAVLMRPADTADGANVVQKGFSVGGGTQYKLQVDGVAGRPSCVVASPTHIYRVVAPVRVADGRWHALGCTRAGAALAISVDGVARGSTKLPANLSIVNAEPLRIGGKSVTVNNDQYAGLVDDVYVTIN
ncbi:LamG-like jellyroll fold domain-containing protein [Catenuloplanes sp. NPDC051500]|uniref:LamG-like jellyroll fold domain-containing protein n=1 Tax=Catenuloplanes sp. NPDC051500 TaxID=3363959 RepID=UPI00378A8ED1